MEHVTSEALPLPPVLGENPPLIDSSVKSIMKKVKAENTTESNNAVVHTEENKVNENQNKITIKQLKSQKKKDKTDKDETVSTPQASINSVSPVGHESNTMINNKQNDLEKVNHLENFVKNSIYLLIK